MLISLVPCRHKKIAHETVLHSHLVRLKATLFGQTIAFHHPTHLQSEVAVMKTLNQSDITADKWIREHRLHA